MMEPTLGERIWWEAEQRAQASARSEAVDYRWIRRRFQLRHEADRHGLGHALAGIEGEGGWLPPRRPTRRGRFSYAVVRTIAKPLWWIHRALGLRDDALRGAYRALLEEKEHRARLEDRVRELEQRIDRLEQTSSRARTSAEM